MWWRDPRTEIMTTSACVRPSVKAPVPSIPVLSLKPTLRRPSRISLGWWIKVQEEKFKFKHGILTYHTPQQPARRAGAIPTLMKCGNDDCSLSAMSVGGASSA